MNSPSQTEPSPLVGALSISASFFVTFTSFFVAVLAIVAGMHQLDSIGLAKRHRDPNTTYQWISFAIAAVVIVNGLLAGARARTNPRVAAVTSAVFVVLTVATGILYVNAW